ncbi:unnamed protein product [Camellia sinensis]
MELIMPVIYYPYRRLHHGTQHVYSLLPGIGGSIMELITSAIYYPYRRLHHGAQHVYSLLPGSGGFFMELVIHNHHMFCICPVSALLALMDVPRMIKHDLQFLYMI